MRVPFPSDVDAINRTDFDILRCLHMQGPAWKMEITRRLNHRREHGPLLIDYKPSITKQAVSNRVQRLHDLEYVETTILTVAGLESEVLVEPDQAFIPGYGLSEKGEDALRDGTKRVLRDAFAAMVSREDGERPSLLDAYSQMFFDLTPDTAVEDATFEDFVLYQID